MENRPTWSSLELILNPAKFATMGLPSLGKSVMLFLPIDGSTCTLSFCEPVRVRECMSVHVCTRVYACVHAYDLLASSFGDS